MFGQRKIKAIEFIERMNTGAVSARLEIENYWEDFTSASSVYGR